MQHLINVEQQLCTHALSSLATPAVKRSNLVPRIVSLLTACELPHVRCENTVAAAASRGTHARFWVQTKNSIGGRVGKNS